MASSQQRPPRPSKQPESFELPIRSMIRVPYFIYLPCPLESVPKLEELRKVVLKFWKKHTESDIGKVGEEMLEQNFLYVEEPVEADDPFAQAFADFIGGLEEPASVGGRRLRDAQSCLQLWASDLITEPRIGSWFGILGVTAIAMAYKGVALDASTGQIMPLTPPPDHPISVYQELAIAGHTTAVPDFDAKGRLKSIRTIGLGKYGLPEMEMRGLEGADQNEVATLMMGSAYALYQKAAQAAEEGGPEGADTLRVGPRIEVSAADVALGFAGLRNIPVPEEQQGRHVALDIAYKRGKQPRPEELPEGFVPFLLDVGREEYDGLLRLGPAPKRGQPKDSSWVHEAVAQLGLGETK